MRNINILLFDDAMRASIPEGVAAQTQAGDSSDGSQGRNGPTLLGSRTPPEG